MRLPITLGRYEFLSRLGDGAVYAGREHGELGLVHDVAVRVVGVADGAIGDLRGLAERARALAQIGHPCVVPIRDFAALEHDELGALQVIVSPLVAGVPLASVLRQCREQRLVLPLAATLHLLLQLTDTLEAVHDATDAQGRSLGLVHGSLSPSRLMISRQGDLRVLGFGVPRSPKRCAPVPPDEAVDARSDLYAVGALAYQMLLGEPFAPTDGAPITADALQASFGMSRGHAEHLADLLVRLLQTDRERRFPHARALRAALESVAPEARLRRGRRWLGAVASGLPVADRSRLEGKLTPVVERAPEPAPAPRSESSWAVPVGLLVVCVAALGAAALWADDAPSEPLAITQARTTAEINAATAKLPPLLIAHTPPLRGPESGDRVFRATVSGGTVDCVPRMQMRAVAGGRWVSRPMRGSGADWELPMTATELDAFAGAVEYWIRCGRSGLTPRASWRSPGSPHRLDL